jgi:hypothetical protein
MGRLLRYVSFGLKDANNPPHDQRLTRTVTKITFHSAGFRYKIT